jgi:hypothetical protein
VLATLRGVVVDCCAISFKIDHGPAAATRTAFPSSALTFAGAPVRRSADDRRENRWATQATCERSATAASMRSAIRCPVKPTSSCRSLGAPWVT